eukprot:851982-Rhodomonas_salina.4
MVSRCGGGERESWEGRDSREEAPRTLSSFHDDVSGGVGDGDGVGGPRPGAIEGGGWCGEEGWGRLLPRLSSIRTLRPPEEQGASVRGAGVRPSEEEGYDVGEGAREEAGEDEMG